MLFRKKTLKSIKLTFNCQSVDLTDLVEDLQDLIIHHNPISITELHKKKI